MKSARVGEWFLRKVGDWIAFCLLCLSSSPLTLAQTDHNLMQQDRRRESGSAGSSCKLGLNVVDFIECLVLVLVFCSLWSFNQLLFLVFSLDMPDQLTDMYVISVLTRKIQNIGTYN